MSNTPVDLIPASVAPDGTHAHTEEQLHFAEIPQAASHTVPSLLDLRIQKGLSPEAVASALRLSQAQIHALEAQNWSVLPGAAYIKGFLRNYTRLLNVAPEPYIAQYEASLGTASLAGTPHTSVAPKTTAYVSAAMPALPADPAALPTFTASGHEQKSQQSIAGIIGLLIAATLVFLLYWERALWLPKVVAVTESAVSWVTQPFASKPKAAPTAPAVAPSPAETTTPTQCRV
jgi:cytoskeleton protein RodZ